MSFVNILGSRMSEVGLAAATSANGTARTGATLELNKVHPGTLVAECISDLTTSSVAATFKPQVSTDGSTFVDYKPQNNATSVATTAGTGAQVVSTIAIGIDAGVCAYPYFRMAATLAGAATAAGDQTTVTYRYLRAFELEG